jgi:hypothetical protein
MNVASDMPRQPGGNRHLQVVRRPTLVTYRPIGSRPGLLMAAPWPPNLRQACDITCDRHKHKRIDPTLNQPVGIGYRVDAGEGQPGRGSKWLARSWSGRQSLVRQQANVGHLLQVS